MLPTAEKLATIVICEDDPITREALCENFEADRFEPLAAATAEEALRFCRYATPDVLLIDIGLPDASGLDVIREIRAATGPAPPYDPDLPIVALSGRSSDADRVRGLRDGADDYLVKPFFYEELHERIRKLLARRDGTRRGPTRIGLLSIDPATREVKVGEREVDPRQQGVRAAAHARLRADPRLHQGGAAARHLGIPDCRSHPDPRLARQPAAPQARSRARHVRDQLLGRRLPPPGRVMPWPRGS